MLGAGQELKRLLQDYILDRLNYSCKQSIFWRKSDLPWGITLPTSAGLSLAAGEATLDELLMEEHQMPTWKVEEIVFDNFGLTRYWYGPYNSREQVSLALTSLVRNIDRSSVIEWSTCDGESKMIFVPARRWENEHVD